MKRWTDYILSIIFLLLGQTSYGQNGQTYEAYFIKNGSEVVIDSLSYDSSLKVLIDFPKNISGSSFSGQGKVRYIRTFIHDTCAFIIHINLVADSLYISTSVEYSYDPCRGQIDLADIIWDIFSSEIKAVYIRRSNNEILLQNKKTTIALRYK